MSAIDEADLLLASRSPRRRELLAQIGLRFALLEVAVDERRHPGEAPASLVERLARAKADAGVALAGEAPQPVLAADTVIAVDGDVLGKPAGEAEALAMLARLSGRSHDVLTGVAVARGETVVSRIVTSRVTLRELAPIEAAAYWASGEPAGKAGAYAIQGLGAVFVERLEGSYSNVVGLPLHETAALLARFGVDPLGNRADA
ncbi:MAG: Maf family protein [Halofilum sp. (in: g-proteobacteria)]